NGLGWNARRRASISHAANIASGAAEIVMRTRAAVTLPVSADVAFAWISASERQEFSLREFLKRASGEPVTDRSARRRSRAPALSPFASKSGMSPFTLCPNKRVGGCMARAWMFVLGVVMSSGAVGDTVEGREALHATLWMQRSPEYRAIAEQTYRLAAQKLATPAPGSAAVEQKDVPADVLARMPTAVVMDLDETV